MKLVLFFSKKWFVKILARYRNYFLKAKHSLISYQLSKELKSNDSEFYFIKLNEEIVGYLKLNKGECTKLDEGNSHLVYEHLPVLFLLENLFSTLYTYVLYSYCTSTSLPVLQYTVLYICFF